MRRLTTLIFFIGIAGSVICQTMPVFGPEKKVTLSGWTSDAMEPFLSPNGSILFFNSLNSGGNTNLYYANKVNDTLFNYVGLVGGTYDTSANHLDGVPSLDSANNFFWVSARGYPLVMENLHRGKFASGNVTNISRVYGNFNVYAFNYPFGWMIMDAAINYQTDQLYYCNALFDFSNTSCVGVPCKARLGVAQKINDSTFSKLSNSEGIFSLVNDTNYIVYAPVITKDGLELYYSRILKSTINSEICVSVRTQPGDTFSLPQIIHSKPGFLPEAPTVTTDKQKLYYHQKDSSLIFRLYMRERSMLTGIEEVTNDKTFKVYPNPTKNRVWVTALHPEKPFSIELYDVVGQQLMESVSQASLDLSTLPAGIYYLCVYQDGLTGRQKIIRE